MADKKKSRGKKSEPPTGGGEWPYAVMLAQDSALHWYCKHGHWFCLAIDGGLRKVFLDSKNSYGFCAEPSVRSYFQQHHIPFTWRSTPKSSMRLPLSEPFPYPNPANLAHRQVGMALSLNQHGRFTPHKRLGEDQNKDGTNER